jgi:hypothetical protein
MGEKSPALPSVNLDRIYVALALLQVLPYPLPWCLAFSSSPSSSTFSLSPPSAPFAPTPTQPSPFPLHECGSIDIRRTPCFRILPNRRTVVDRFHVRADLFSAMVTSFTIKSYRWLDQAFRSIHANNPYLRQQTSSATATLQIRPTSAFFCSSRLWKSAFFWFLCLILITAPEV